MLLKLFCVTQSGIKFLLGFEVKFKWMADLAIRAVRLEKHRFFIFRGIRRKTSYITAVIAVFLKRARKFRSDLFDLFNRLVI